MFLKNTKLKKKTKKNTKLNQILNRFLKQHVSDSFNMMMGIIVNIGGKGIKPTASAKHICSENPFHETCCRIESFTEHTEKCWLRHTFIQASLVLPL